MAFAAGNAIDLESVPGSQTYNYSDCEIPILEAENLSYETFFRDFMVKNLPCVVKNISYTWECSTKWIINNSINTEHFIKEYGSLIAPVADCNLINFNTQCKVDMTIGDYMNYLSSGNKEKLLYLKDWHLRRARPEDNFYEVPLIFASDWLNEYSLDKAEDDFMFVYIGPKDTWTPLHVDVYSSYSWSVNVSGRKKWILLPPNEQEKLKDPLGRLPLLYDPNIHRNIKSFEINQEKGDAIFVPSGWHHQVTNSLDTISINHNWINGCNIQEVWKALQECLKSVEHEIEEFKDTADYTMQCQMILKSLFGMNYESFILFLCHIAKKRVRQLKGEEFLFLKKYTFGMKHVQFDLSIILKVMDCLCNIPNFFVDYSLKHLEENLLSTKSTVSNILM